MRCAVRYYSRSGNTKAAAEAIARGAGTYAISVDKANAGLKDKVDVLFLGGALYAYGIDKELKAYIQALDAAKVKKAVLFSTSWLSKHALDIMKKELAAKGIAVESETFYCKGKPDGKTIEEAVSFGTKYAK